MLVPVAGTITQVSIKVVNSQAPAKRITFDPPIVVRVGDDVGSLINARLQQ